jgi:hypothetical protein
VIPSQGSGDYGFLSTHEARTPAIAPFWRPTICLSGDEYLEVAIMNIIVG